MLLEVEALERLLLDGEVMELLEVERPLEEWIAVDVTVAVTVARPSDTVCKSVTWL